MNWEAFGAIGEVTGATAVVVSVIYVSLQVRAGLKGLQTTTRASVFQTLITWNQVIMADPRLAWTFQAGSKDFEALEKEERARYLHVMYGFYKIMENVYLHYEEGVVPLELWTPNHEILSAYATQPGARQYWEARKAAFDPRFNAVVEGLKEGGLLAGHEVSGIAGDST